MYELAKRAADTPSPIVLTKDVAASVLALAEAARAADAEGAGAGAALPVSPIKGATTAMSPTKGAPGTPPGDAALRADAASGGPLDRAYVTIARLERALTSSQARVSSLEGEVVDLRWAAANAGVVLPPAGAGTRPAGVTSPARTGASLASPGSASAAAHYRSPAPGSRPELSSPSKTATAGAPSPPVPTRVAPVPPAL